MTYKPTLTTQVDSLGRRTYWLSTAKNGARIKVHAAWATVLLRKKMIEEEAK